MYASLKYKQDLLNRLENHVSNRKQIKIQKHKKINIK